MTEISFMEIAIQEAQKAKENGEVPIGAVITKNGELIAKAANQTRQTNDPTAHAEIIVIRKAAQIIKNQRLNECDMYVTLEPCTMCAGAISNARIRRLYYGTKDEKGGGVESGVQFFNSQTCTHKPEIYSGFKQQEIEEMLKEFFRQKR